MCSSIDPFPGRIVSSAMREINKKKKKKEKTIVAVIYFDRSHPRDVPGNGSLVITHLFFSNFVRTQAAISRHPPTQINKENTHKKSGLCFLLRKKNYVACRLFEIKICVGVNARRTLSESRKPIHSGRR